jgi:hypothetical protein
MDHRAEILDWLTTFEKFVREKNFEDAKLLYKDSSTLFGTRVEYSTDIEHYQKFQWSNVWDTSENFTISQVVQMDSDDTLAIAAVLWTNTTSLDDVKVQRSGRATFVYEIQDGIPKAIHSHFSESPK